MVADVLSFYCVRVCGVLPRRRWGRFWRYRSFTTAAFSDIQARREALHRFNNTFPYAFSATAVIECSEIESGDTQ